MQCSICENEIPVNPINGWDQGNNAEPINDGRCCDGCNQFVIAVRMGVTTGEFIVSTMKSLNDKA